MAVTSKIYHYYFFDAGGISKPCIPYVWKYVSVLGIQSGRLVVIVYESKRLRAD
jgi:hypothetical protein